jgi:hypothetical protein
MYRALYRRAKQDGTGNIPSLARLAQDLVLAGCRPIPGRTLKRRLSDLKAWGWVRTDRRMVDGKFGGQRRGTNRYTLLVPLAHLPMVAPTVRAGKTGGMGSSEALYGGPTVRTVRSRTVGADRKLWWPHGPTSDDARTRRSHRGASSTPAKPQVAPWGQSYGGPT